MSLTKLSLAGNNLIIAGQRDCLVGDIPAGDEKIANFFLQCTPGCPAPFQKCSLQNWEKNLERFGIRFYFKIYTFSIHKTISYTEVDFRKYLVCPFMFFKRWEVSNGSLMKIRPRFLIGQCQEIFEFKFFFSPSNSFNQSSLMLFPKCLGSDSYYRLLRMMFWKIYRTKIKCVTFCKSNDFLKIFLVVIFA
jgi:hypothetical protein